MAGERKGLNEKVQQLAINPLTIRQDAIAIRLQRLVHLHLGFIPGIAMPKGPEHCEGQPAPRRDLRAR